MVFKERGMINSVGPVALIRTKMDGFPGRWKMQLGLSTEPTHFPGRSQCHFYPDATVSFVKMQIKKKEEKEKVTSLESIPAVYWGVLCATTTNFVGWHHFPGNFFNVVIFWFFGVHCSLEACWQLCFINSSDSSWPCVASDEQTNLSWAGALGAQAALMKRVTVVHPLSADVISWWLNSGIQGNVLGWVTRRKLWERWAYPYVMIDSL